jgi:hypothetical protein
VTRRKPPGGQQRTIDRLADTDSLLGAGRTALENRDFPTASDAFETALEVR